MTDPEPTAEERAERWGWNKQSAGNSPAKGCLIALGIVVALGILCGLLSTLKQDNQSVASTNSAPTGDTERFIKSVRQIDPDRALFVLVGQGVDADTVNVTVATGWHYQPYQVRLQAAQSAWQMWANIRSPSEPDKARISLRDLNGNEVGGSRVWGGSLIWVQEK